MLRLTSLFFIAMFCACSEDKLDDTSCSTHATVKDLTGLDGCGFVFELEDGSRLIPVILLQCGTPEPKDKTPDPISSFEFVDGKKVMIDYQFAEGFADMCMAGKYAKITCISELRTQMDL